MYFFFPKKKKYPQKKKQLFIISGPSAARTKLPHTPQQVFRARGASRSLLSSCAYVLNIIFIFPVPFVLSKKGIPTNLPCTRCGRQVHSPRLFGEHFFFFQPFFPRPVQIYYTHTRPNPFYVAHCAPCTHTHIHIYTHMRFALYSPLYSGIQHYYTSAYASRFGRSSPDTRRILCERVTCC